MSSDFKGKYYEIFVDNITSYNVPRASRTNEFMDFNALAVAFSEKELEENSPEYLEWVAKTKKSIELVKMKRCASGFGEQEIESEVRLSVKKHERRQRSSAQRISKFTSAISSAYNTVTNNGKQQHSPKDTAKMIEEVIGRTHGLIAGHGIPQTEKDVTQSQRMFDSMSKHKNHTLSGMLFPISLCSFTYQHTKKKEEGRMQLCL